MAADQLVGGEAALQVLGDHVDVLEVALDQVAVVGSGGAGRAIDALDDLRGQADAVGRCEAERGPPLQRHRARRRRLRPDVRHRLHEEGPPGAEGRLRVPHRHLGHRLVPQQPLHGARRLGAREVEEGLETASRDAEGHQALV